MNITVHTHSGHYTVTLGGQFTFTDHPAFREVLDSIDRADVTCVTMDLSRVEFVDSAALGMLLLANDAAKKTSKKLVIRGTQGQVKKMFDMANFHTMFTLE
ncbi:MAG: STAS domain-containing protein [Rickettsiales bacterium]